MQIHNNYELSANNNIKGVTMSHTKNNINVSKLDNDTLQQHYQELLDTGTIDLSVNYRMILDVQDFNDIFKVPRGATVDNLKLRLKLMEEEYRETKVVIEDAIYSLGDTGKIPAKAHVRILEGLVNQTVINIGTADILGYDFQNAWEEVLSSNLSKISKDGSIKHREDGKILKGDSFKEPCLEHCV